jgi:formylglycine-generating enzyme required for sulfatase activity
MTVFLEALAALVAIYFGILHPTWQTNPVLSNHKWRIALGCLTALLVAGYFYYNHSEKKEEIELEKWEFAREINTKESFCTYLKEYPEGVFANQARQKCEPVNTSEVLKTSKVLEPDMVLIKKGCFMMGSPKTEAERYDNETQHKVCIKQDFQLGKYEVTQAQWTGIMGSNPSGYKDDNLPVENVSYDDIQIFLEKLNAQTGKYYRLPTEAEWEYAARADTTTAFYTGDCINTQQANYNGNTDYNDCGAKTGVYLEKTTPVGSYPPNPWGLYDMAGNVYEWTCSVYVKNYDGNEQRCADSATSRVLRGGGSWGSDATRTRSAIRYNGTPINQDYHVGFRLALGQPAS